MSINENYNSKNIAFIFVADPQKELVYGEYKSITAPPFLKNVEGSYIRPCEQDPKSEDGFLGFEFIDKTIATPFDDGTCIRMACWHHEDNLLIHERNEWWGVLPPKYPAGFIVYEDQLSKKVLANMLTCDNEWLREYAKDYISGETIPINK